MTAALEVEVADDLDVAMERARAALAVQDVQRDRIERDDQVRYLTRMGCSAAEIAERVDLSERHVVRLRSKERLDAEVPHVPDPRTISDERADAVEALAQRAFEWAGTLRDEDPAIVWTALCGLPRHRLQELVMVALAMVPSEATLRSALAWVHELPAAQEAE